MEYSEWIIKILVSAVFAYFWHDKNKADAAFIAHKSEINKKVDALLITQAKHEIQLNDIGVIKQNVSDMLKAMHDLTVELRVSNASRDQEKNR